MSTRLTLSLSAFAVLVASIALAGEPTARRREDKDRIEMPGTVVSVGATLESMGANAEETLYAKGAQGLLAPDGTLWTLVDNAKGHGVITNPKLRGKEVKVLGWKFPRAQYVELSRYSVKEGDGWVAYDFCKNCGWEPGDNKGTDLCEDCREGAAEGTKEGGQGGGK